MNSSRTISNKLKLFIVTPCFNAGHYIEETILSVVNQPLVREGKADLEYWVVDGGSTDGTIAILEKYANIGALKFISEKDQGMYDALRKGFQNLTSPSVCAYLNAGDLFSNQAFSIAKEIFSEFKDIKWFTGISTLYNERSQVVRFDYPFKYRRALIQQGFYGTLLPYIQQESTFWKSELMEGLSWSFLSELKLAGDAYLWNEFSKRADFYVVQAFVGGFKLHDGQLSEQITRYREERTKFTSPKTVSGFFFYLIDKIFWGRSLKIKKLANSKMIVFDLKQRRWKA